MIKPIGILLIICVLLYCFNQNSIEHMTTNHNDFTEDEMKAINKFKINTKQFKKNMIKQITFFKILKKTKHVLDELKIPFFLSSGTCLGYFREDKFLDHDYDIDIGIFREDYKHDIISKMAKKGLRLYRTLGCLETGLELSFRLNGTKLGRHAKIDIFLHYRDGDNIYWTSYAAPQFKKRIKYQVSNFVLKPVNFMDITVNVPYPTIKYIREHYGEKWYIPIKTKGQGGTYDYRTSPTSVTQ